MRGYARFVFVTWRSPCQQMQKKAKTATSREAPPFNEAILNPADGEIVCAVRTMPLHEFKLDEHCRTLGLVTYLPVRRCFKIHNFTQKGRLYTYSREVLRPLFPSYLFVKTDLQTLRGLYETRMLQRYLPPVDQARFLDELRVVRKCELVGFEQELEIHEDIREGGKFLITSGIWEGVEGVLERKDDVCKWTVEIEFCQQFITTTIDPSLFKMKPLDA